MNYLFREKECDVLVMAFQAQPKRDKRGYITVMDDFSHIEVRGHFHCEAVDIDGNILDVGQWLTFFVKKGTKFTVRRVKPPRDSFTIAEITKARKKTRITVVDHQQYDGGLFNFGASYEDGTLDKVLRSLQAIRRKIPPKYRAKASCDIDSVSGYEGSHYAHIEVTYSRPETDAEVRDRLQAEETETMLEERKRRAKFKTLAAEFCPASTAPQRKAGEP